MGWREELNRYFQNGIKETHENTLGVEIEHFIVRRDTHAAIPYAGEEGVEQLLRRLMGEYPDAVAEGTDALLGFSTREFHITLEPAAQLEISILPSASPDRIEEIYNGFRSRLDRIAGEMGCAALTVGCQPGSRVEDLTLIPKERYRLMDRYFQKTGSGGRQMMRGTASLQVSVDYHSEEDFRRKLQAAYFFMPVLKLLTDHTARFAGRRVNGALRRTDIWNRTDAARCGILPGVFKEDYGFDDYARFLGEMPLIFTVQDTGYEYTGSRKVSEIFAGRTPDGAEIQHILSLAFPDVRLKNYLEIRFADSVPIKYAMAYCVLLKGLLYREEVLDHVQEKLRNGAFSESDVQEAQQSLMKMGWKGTVYGEPVRMAARRMVRMAAQYLSAEEQERLWVFLRVIDAGGICNLEAAGSKGELTSSALREEYRSLICRDPEKNRAGALNLMRNMERSPLYFRDRFTSKTLQIPRIYTERDVARFRKIVRTAYGIFDKVIREYLNHADYRSLFPFSKELEELIQVPNGYDSLLPIARFDIFYHEDTGEFGFCEINTDGTSGMNEDRLQDELILDNPAHQAMRRRYRFETFELFDSWVDSFLRLYDTYRFKKEKPNVAIVDFLDGGTLREFQEFARHFQKAGVDCEVCDIRELHFSDGCLYSPAGNVIDAIYRRAVTTDILDHMDEVGDFIQAVRENACFVAGSFATQIIHHKWLFHVLHLPRTKQFLTKAENAFVEKHIPATVPFTERYIEKEKVLREKDRYILKPDDSYASNGVYAGVEFSQREWEEKINAAYNADYICQEYCPQYSTENIDHAWGDGQWHSYISMAGLYVYNGRFAGVFSRAAEGSGIIASHRNERTQATYLVRPLTP